MVYFILTRATLPNHRILFFWKKIFFFSYKKLRMKIEYKGAEKLCVGLDRLLAKWWFTGSLKEKDKPAQLITKTCWRMWCDQKRLFVLTRWRQTTHCSNSARVAGREVWYHVISNQLTECGLPNHLTCNHWTTGLGNLSCWVEKICSCVSWGTQGDC